MPGMRDPRSFQIIVAIVIAVVIVVVGGTVFGEFFVGGP